MNNIKKVAGINLLILIVYTLLTNLAGGGSNDKGLQVAVMMMVWVTLHVGILLLAMFYFFIKKNKPAGKTFLLTALIVLVIGFSVCLGSMSIY